MSIRVGTVVNINEAYNNYQRQIKQLKQRKAETSNLKEKKQCDDEIRMTEMEVEEFLQLIIPDPERSSVSSNLAKGYDYLHVISSQDTEEDKKLDMEG